MLLKLESCAEDPGAWIYRDLAGYLFNLGVYSFSGFNFGGCVILSEIGSKNKKDFLSSHRMDGF